MGHYYNKEINIVMNCLIFQLQKQIITIKVLYKPINSDLGELKKVIVLSQQSSGWGHLNRNLYWTIDTKLYPNLTTNNFYIGITEVGLQQYNATDVHTIVQKEYSNGQLHVWINNAGNSYAGSFTCQPILII